MTYFKVCELHEINCEKPKKFNLNDNSILIAKSNNEKIWAFQSMCTHADKSLENGKWNAQTAEISCPFHKAIFDVSQNGLVVKAPAFVSLPTYKTEIRYENGQNFVYVDLE